MCWEGEEGREREKGERPWESVQGPEEGQIWANILGSSLVL